MEFAFLQAASSTSDLTTYTFSSQNLGTAAAGRYIIVAIEARKSGVDTTLLVSSVTVGGVSATIAMQRLVSSTNTNIAALAIAAVPSGTNGNVDVTFSSGMLRCGIQLYRAVDINSSTPHHAVTHFNGSTDPTASLNIPAGGFAIGCATSAASTAATWTGLTEDHDSVVESFLTVSSASQQFASAETGRSITCDFGTNTDNVAVFASWAPAAGGGSFVDNTLPILQHVIGGVL